LITPEINRQANLGLISEEQAWELGIISIHYTNKQRDMAEIERLLGL